MSSHVSQESPENILPFVQLTNPENILPTAQFTNLGGTAYRVQASVAEPTLIDWKRAIADHLDEAAFGAFGSAARRAKLDTLPDPVATRNRARRDWVLLPRFLTEWSVNGAKKLSDRYSRMIFDHRSVGMSLFRTG